MTRDNFLALVDPVDQLLARQKIDGECYTGPLLTDRRLKRAEAKLGFALHDSVRWFYQTVGDGFSYYWSDETLKYVWGSFTIPPLKELIKDRKKILAVANHWLEPPSQESLVVLEEFRKTLTWAPLTDEGDGDSICWDLATGQVVYNKHDFTDTDSETVFNGWIAGDTIIDFTRSWARYCFKSTIGLWWGALIDKQSNRLTWNTDCFDSAFTVNS